MEKDEILEQLEKMRLDFVMWLNRTEGTISETRDNSCEVRGMIRVLKRVVDRLEDIIFPMRE